MAMPNSTAHTMLAIVSHSVGMKRSAISSATVRRVRSEGPQHVTVHGRDEVVVIAAEEYRRLQGLQTGRALVEVLQATPYPEIDLAIAPPTYAPVRDVSL